MNQFGETQKSAWEDPQRCVDDAKWPCDMHARDATSSLKVRILLPFSQYHFKTGKCLSFRPWVSYGMPGWVAPCSSFVIDNNRSAVWSPGGQGWPWGEVWIYLLRCKCAVWGWPSELSSLVHSQSVREVPRVEWKGTRRSKGWWVVGLGQIKGGGLAEERHSQT